MDGYGTLGALQKPNATFYHGQRNQGSVEYTVHDARGGEVTRGISASSSCSANGLCLPLCHDEEETTGCTGRDSKANDRLSGGNGRLMAGDETPGGLHGIKVDHDHVRIDGAFWKRASRQADRGT